MIDLGNRERPYTQSSFTDRDRLLQGGLVILLIILCIAVVPAAYPSMAQSAQTAQAVALVAFVACHALWGYGIRGAATFFGVAAVVSFALEVTSVATGFPFGSYTHHLTPQLLGVPAAAIVGWVVLSWLAWLLARVIIRPDPAATSGNDQYTTPIVATFILGGYDLAYDPIAVAHGWFSYANPGGALGVPLTNNFGWLLTGWVVFQIVGLTESRWPVRAPARRRDYWLLPCLCWLATAAQIIALAWPSTVRSPSGDHLDQLYQSCAATALFTMVFTGALAVIRLRAMPTELGT